MTLFQRIRKKGTEQKGFTLGELLIVIAIIGVLVGISIPIFTKQIRKAQIATIVANTRAYYSLVIAEYIECETNSYDWEIERPVQREGDNYYLYFEDHSGNVQTLPLPGFDKLDNHGVIIRWGMSKLDGTDYNYGHTNPELRCINGCYPFLIVTADGEQYLYGTVPDWIKATAEKPAPEEVGFELDE